MVTSLRALINKASQTKQLRDDQAKVADELVKTVQKQQERISDLEGHYGSLDQRIQATASQTKQLRDDQTKLADGHVETAQRQREKIYDLERLYGSLSQRVQILEKRAKL